MASGSSFRTEDLSVRYGGLVALDSVSITVEPGEFAGLIGPNGAGKTTFIDAVTGFAKATGSVAMGERQLLDLPAYRRVEAGVSRTFQSLELFEDLTVRENVLVSTEGSSWWSPVVEFVKPRRAARITGVVEDVLDLVGLGAHMEAFPPDLSLSQRKLVSVARALATEPDLLLLDEPAAGLDSDASLALGQQLKVVAEQGIAILLVDHDISLILDVCERINVLDFGRLIATGPTDQVKDDPAVLAAYLGQDVHEADALAGGAA